MLREQTFPAPAAVLKDTPSAQDVFLVGDLPEFLQAAFDVPSSCSNRSQAEHGGSWYGRMSYDTAIKTGHTGDLSMVPASDKLLTELEAFVPMSQAWSTINDVTGAVPNIPEFLTGNPVHMRRRKRVLSQQAPLAIMVELVASAGIKAEICQKRGVALLALTRMLASFRPVELWIVIAVGSRGRRVTSCIRLDTAPLDLARACFVMTHTAFFRGLGYATCEHYGYDKHNKHWGGNWGWGDHELHRRTAREAYIQVLNPGSEALYVPPVHLNDQCVTEPVKWLKSMIAEYGGVQSA